ncbi:MAG: hypothetical protein ACFFD6_08595, partial [Candidatus Thorarchaeota archaeon]
EVPVVVIENKIDLNPIFSPEDIQNEIGKRNLKLMQTSATQGMNVDKTFEELVRTIRKSKS